jgi:Family of unknown function (DUF5719)
MNGSGRLGLAIVTVAVVAGGALVLDRTQPPSRAGLAPRVASSGAWLCPHGGGGGWTTDLYVANPGAGQVEVRVTSLSSRRAEPPAQYSVAAGAGLRIEGASSDGAAASYIEYFGGWIAAGWVTHAGNQASGVAAEPCAPEPGTRWLAPDGTTEKGEDATLVIMNPFDVDAVVDVTVLSAQRAPIRESSLTNLRVAPHRSRFVRLNGVSADEPVAAAQIDAHAGRVAVASLGVSDEGGIRGALAVGSASPRLFLPGTHDVGQSTLAVMVPGEAEARFGATLLSQEPPEPAGGLTATNQSGQSARAHPLITQGASLVDLEVLAGSPPLTAVRRSEGQNGDPGATAGTAVTATAWVVLPTVAGTPNDPGMMLGNPGAEAIEVSLTSLGPDGVTDRISVTVPADSAIGVPPAFIERDPTAPVLARSTARFVAAGASSSLGREGTGSYAVAAGVPVPGGVEIAP